MQILNLVPLIALIFSAVSQAQSAPEASPAPSFTVELAPSLEVTFGAESVQLDGASAARLDLRATTLRRGARTVDLPEATRANRGSRVEYTRGDVIEWYRVEGRALEQGFTLRVNPLPVEIESEVGELQLELELGPGWTATLSDDTRDAWLVPPSGRGCFPYTSLRAWDAKGTELGARLALDGEAGLLTIAVDDRKAVYPLTIDPLIRYEDAKLWATDGAIEDWFGGGNSGQGVSIDGDTLVVGAPWDDDNGGRSGAAYAFARRGGGWVQEAKLVPSDGGLEDWAGTAVAISGDLALVSSQSDDDMGSGAGAAYVFARSDSSWTQEAKLLASDGDSGDWLGHALALDGDTAVVGAYKNDEAAQDAGAVYVFVRQGTTWTEQAKLTASDAAVGDLFGKAVGVDGDTVIVGATWADTVEPQAGAAYVFVRSGATWTEQQKFFATDVTSTGASGVAFGFNVAVSGDSALVGALGDNSIVDNASAAYVYARTGTSWSQEARLIAPDFEERDFFGFSVDLDGDLALISAYQEDFPGLHPGKAFVFERAGTTWAWRAELLASDELPDVDFGRAAALSGRTCVVSSPHAEGAVPNSGAAYVYEITPLPDFVALCFGEGSGTPCPCGNEGWIGSHAGCANQGGSGGLLFAAGSPSVSVDDLRLQARHLLPGQPALAFLGANTIGGGNGVSFGDGLRCAGGGIVRLGTATPDSIGSAEYGPGLAAAAGLVAGDHRTFQVWYRDPGGPCASDFNLTNALVTSFGP